MHRQYYFLQLPVHSMTSVNHVSIVSEGMLQISFLIMARLIAYALCVFMILTFVTKNTCTVLQDIHEDVAPTKAYHSNRC